MEIPSIFIGLALFAAALAYISLPFRQKQLKSLNSSDAHTQQKGQREATLSALRDLDFDFNIGKISEEDYTPLRIQLVAEVAEYIKTEEKEDQQLEALIQTRRAAQKTSSACQHCGAPLQADQGFCSKCGSAAKNEFCPSCSKEIHAGDLFCASCGTKLDVLLRPVAQS